MSEISNMPTPAEMSTLGKSQSRRLFPDARLSWLKWPLTILAFIMVGVILTAGKGTSALRFSDIDMARTGDWSLVEIARYSEGQASVARTSGVALTADIGEPTLISTASLRYFDYGDGETIYTISAGDRDKTVKIGGAKGIRLKTVEFSPPVLAETVTVTVSSLGQGRAVIDHLSVTRSERTGLTRMIFIGGLFGLFAISLWLATLLVAPPKSSSGKIYESVDVLRGIGVLLVVLLHATGYAGLPDLSARPLLSSLADAGHFGVEIFYVVSAYTLTYSLASMIRRDQDAKIPTFWNRRFNRIVPTLLACLLLAYLFRGTLTSGLTPSNLFPTIGKFLSMGYVFDREVLLTPIGHSVWWSISTEFQFYIVMPLLFLPIMASLAKTDMSPRIRTRFAGGIVIVGILISAVSRHVLTGQPWLNYTVLYHFDAFAIGIATAILMTRQTASPVKTRDTLAGAAGEELKRRGADADSKKLHLKPWGWLAPMGVMGFLALIVATSDIVGAALSLPRIFNAPRLWVVVACATAIFVTRWLEDRDVSFSGLAWMRTLGLLSFLVYLLHIPVMQIITQLPVPGIISLDSDYYFWVLLLGLTGSVILSIGLHLLVERQSLKLNMLAERQPVLKGLTTAYVGVVILSLILYLGSA